MEMRRYVLSEQTQKIWDRICGERKRANAASLQMLDASSVVSAVTLDNVYPPLDTESTLECLSVFMYNANA